MSLFTSIDLTTGWEFKRSNDTSLQAWRQVDKLPTVVHLDLMRYNLIPDPFRDLNESKVQWVGEESWSYRCSFTPSPKDDADRVALLFEGLDTFAHVKLNGTDILQSNNMFISHHIDVTSLLNFSGKNILEIDFESALLKARDIRREHPEHNYIGHLGEVERLGVRKAPYHWGWDWGPKLMTAGPWRPIRLQKYSSRIEDIWLDYTLDEALKHCEGTIFARVDGCVGDEIRLALRNQEGDVLFEKRLPVHPEGHVQAEFALQNVALWYPHGYGSQSLYYIDGEVFTNDKAVHLLARRVGFRRAELIQEADIYGKAFYFRVNGIDIFAGGNCWIPADSCIPRLSAERYRQWIRLMVEGNQIMTRVWGGGIYEEDIFYDTCDELGILVWQDFMFACGSYPVFPSYLQSVESEARANVRRLRHHPSIIIYAGGNENYYIQETYGLSYDYEGDKDPQSWLKSTFPSRYIYEHLLPRVVSEESSSVVYRPDSPWGDGKPILDPSVGDIHQWEVWHGIMRPYQTYEQIGGRFNSEFGMEAFPHMSTIMRFVSDPKEMYSQSLTMDFHNKARGYERRLGGYILENFRVSTTDFKYWVYLTQLVQSEAMNYAYRGWRRHWGKPSARRSGGALVWQLNDCWPTISWAVVDHYLVKKPAFYSIKRSMEPLSVNVLRKHQDWTAGHACPALVSHYDIWVASSKTTMVKEAVLEVRFISIRTGLDSFPPQKHAVRVQPNSTTTVCQGIPIQNPAGHDTFVICAKLVVDSQVISRHADWPQPYKYLSFDDDRGLVIRFEDDYRHKLRVSASKPVKGLVFSERPGLNFSDNGFDVIPGEEYSIEVRGLQENELLEYI
ncbi:glycoside hydrolase superfamily [Talaromyces proteolyticus]|uniref:Beta-mannosidase B n=1 Tax=Talaromyces proteolyticus TaxID=1131652 RepID=A0AAD4KRW7_9EURO|nr:glycoside hydrolase superfamily [Talaromyces proteolyticus]KAH8697483.1 glycoside hydrolase superfamily [Talaromyces proteolyticus]